LDFGDITSSKPRESQGIKKERNQLGQQEKDSNLIYGARCIELETNFILWIRQRHTKRNLTNELQKQIEAY
jgi:hypothetical protein